MDRRERATSARRPRHTLKLRSRLKPCRCPSRCTRGPDRSWRSRRFAARLRFLRGVSVAVAVAVAVAVVAVGRRQLRSPWARAWRSWSRPATGRASRSRAPRWPSPWAWPWARPAAACVGASVGSLRRGLRGRRPARVSTAAGADDAVAVGVGSSAVAGTPSTAAAAAALTGRWTRIRRVTSPSVSATRGARLEPWGWGSDPIRPYLTVDLSLRYGRIGYVCARDGRRRAGHPDRGAG